MDQEERGRSRSGGVGKFFASGAAAIAHVRFISRGIYLAFFPQKCERESETWKIGLMIDQLFHDIMMSNM